jgi:hypothetical protein
MMNGTNSDSSVQASGAIPELVDGSDGTKRNAELQSMVPRRVGEPCHKCRPAYEER